MFRPYQFWVGLRYARPDLRKNLFALIISIFSVLGIALGETTLITVLSVMNGFEQELRTRILGMTSHVTVQAGFSNDLNNWPQVVKQTEENPQVKFAAPYVQGEAMMRHGDRFSGGLVRGIDPKLERFVSTIGEHIIEGELTDLVGGEYGIVLGSELARALGVGVGDKVDLLIPQATVTPAGVLPRFRRFTVRGVFHLDYYEYDRSLVLTHLDDARKLYRLGDAVTGVRLKLDDLFQAPLVKMELAEDLGPLFYVSDWTSRHKNFFQAIATEKSVMFFLLLIIIAVAAFNILSSQVMIVISKQADIAILRTLGATRAGIMSIFVIQGTFIGSVGTVLGLIGGVALATNVDTVIPFLEQVMGRQVLPPEIYVISELRGELHWPDVIQTGVAAFGLCVVSSLFPAIYASMTQPAEALRYE